MNYRRASLLLLLFIQVLLFGCSAGDDNNLPAFTLSKRPAADERLFDYAGVFSNIEESTRRYLELLAGEYGIETCILTLVDLPQPQTVQELAVTVFNNWQIGRNHGGRGLLLVLIESEKLVKFEVGYELEDVFTDAFSGYMENRQVGPNYRDGNLEVGIVALFEEVEKRAGVYVERFSTENIAQLDAELLSGGAGITGELREYENTAQDKAAGLISLAGASLTGARSPDRAWEILLEKWAGASSYRDIDIYTEAAKDAMGDQNSPQDKRVRDQALMLGDVPYVVKQEGNLALVHFNRKKGWEYAPFLFVFDGTGWKFDIVGQRKFVVFGRNGSWSLQRGDHRYNTLFHGMKSSFGKDIPFTDDVVYSVADDRQIAADIQILEKRFAAGGDEQIETALELGRLGVVTARRPNHVYPSLNRAKKLGGAAESHKYLAVYHVMSSFQYESALKEIEVYNKMTDSLFGLNMKGFLQHKTGDYSGAVKTFRKSLERGESIYVLCKLARAEAMLYLTMPAIDPRRSAHKQEARETYGRAKELDPHNWRLPLLHNWLRYKKIFH